MRLLLLWESLGLEINFAVGLKVMTLGMLGYAACKNILQGYNTSELVSECQ